MCFFRRDYERPELVVAPIDERRLQMFLILLVGIGIGAAQGFLDRCDVDDAVIANF